VVKINVHLLREWQLGLGRVDGLGWWVSNFCLGLAKIWADILLLAQNWSEFSVSLGLIFNPSSPLGNFKQKC